ncbi:uncharacterized protein LOC105201688 isoform X1 [Solenopsis invicta]|uniref:uncharacterized protein LOC105201688 isoform X1 n=1 Tax=Solenopsis invicta TaxID=13686 RepID=UPI00193D6BE5|nr:uncharacterized protein LOC105201688 isoform X1 [Solenopsis invicta]
MEEPLFEFPVFFEETQSVITLFLTQEVMNKVQTDENLLQSLVNEEIAKNNSSSTSSRISQTSTSSENLDSDENCLTTNKGFIWPDAAVYLLLELYREKELDFSSGFKRSTTIWAEIAEKMKENSNGKYAVSRLQCSVKMSGLKRTFKNISDQNKKSGNCRNTWAFYSVMDSIFGKKAFVMPSAIASSEGPLKPINVENSAVAESESPSLPSNPCKKRRVETLLESFIGDIKENREIAMAKKEKERKEREKLKEQRYAERKEEQKKIHEDKMEVQKSLIEIMKALVEKQK